MNYHLIINYKIKIFINIIMKHLDITNDNALQSNINLENGNWLAWYHADWCGHCIRMKDEWEKLINNNPNFNTVKANTKTNTFY